MNMEQVNINSYIIDFIDSKAYNENDINIYIINHLKKCGTTDTHKKVRKLLFLKLLKMGKKPQ